MASNLLEVLNDCTECHKCSNAPFSKFFEYLGKGKCEIIRAHLIYISLKNDGAITERLCVLCFQKKFEKETYCGVCGWSTVDDCDILFGCGDPNEGICTTCYKLDEKFEPKEDSCAECGNSAESDDELDQQGLCSECSECVDEKD